VLGGQDFVAGGKLAFDGESPIALTWTPVRSATAYHLDIWRLTPQYTMLAASFYTDDASLLIPASLFHDGDVLAMILGAEQFPRPIAGSLVPNGLPRRTAELASGRFRLMAHCGDGVIQPGEECDDSRETAECNADCTVAQCGDGILNATFGEECDDVFASAGCTDTCTRTMLRRPERL
jgi:cysteine-rich repeat protein